jgi:hypothetical protein
MFEHSIECQIRDPDAQGLKVLGKPLLFLSSYAPLFALLAIRFSPAWLSISCALLAGRCGAADGDMAREGE